MMTRSTCAPERAVDDGAHSIASTVLRISSVERSSASMSRGTRRSAMTIGQSAGCRVKLGDPEGIAVLPLGLRAEFTPPPRQVSEVPSADFRHTPNITRNRVATSHGARIGAQL